MTKLVCVLCEHFKSGTICKLGYIQKDNENCIGYKKMKPIKIEKIDKAKHIFIDEMASMVCENMRDIGHEPTEYLPYGQIEEDVIKPSHYKAGDFDVIAFCQKHDLNFDVGNVIKYVTRAGKKKDNSELQDLNKAMEYLRRRIEFVKGE